MDNCYAEFSYSLNRKGVERILPVVMEERCLDTRRWHGVVGLRLGSKLYLDCSEEAGTEGFETSLLQVVDEVRGSVNQMKAGIDVKRLRANLRSDRSQRTSPTAAV